MSYYLSTDRSGKNTKDGGKSMKMEATEKRNIISMSNRGHFLGKFLAAKNGMSVKRYVELLLEHRYKEEIKKDVEEFIQLKKKFREEFLEE
jgi:hypothetical protein